MPPAATNLQLRSLMRPDGQLELSLVATPVPTPAADEVVVRVEAVPINPSDVGVLFAGADLSTLRVQARDGGEVLSADVPAAAMPALAARLGEPLPAGNEGAGVVMAAGESPAAQALIGRTVSLRSGGMYAQWRCVPAAHCLLLPEGTSPVAAASSFINPMTALGMVETMRREGHSALVHTAAASNLGQMLERICREDGIELVNIVRRPEQAELLRAQGARWVCDTSAPGFAQELDAALTATRATLAFDAIGGGSLAGTLLSAMEAVLRRDAAYSRYGSPVRKQVYIYGGLGAGPIELPRDLGMAWGVGGWLLTYFLKTLDAEGFSRLQARIVAGLDTTFASTYGARIPLADMLRPEIAANYARAGTSAKYLVEPQR